MGVWNVQIFIIAHRESERPFFHFCCSDHLWRFSACQKLKPLDFTFFRSPVDFSYVQMLNGPHWLEINRDRYNHLTKTLFRGITVFFARSYFSQKRYIASLAILKSTWFCKVLKAVIILIGGIFIHYTVSMHCFMLFS